MNSKVETKHLNDVIANHGQDLSGKVAAITGTTTGTGYVCARELAKKGATVLLLNRKSSRSESAVKQLQDEVPNGKFENIECDLQRFSSVRNAIKEITNKYEVLDILVNNAGVMALKDMATEDGYDVQIQTNVLSHFLLTKDLFPLLKKSALGRIVNHSSMARLGGPLQAQYFGANGGNLGGDGTDEESIGFQGPRWERYHQTKLANAVFTYALKNKLEDASVDHVIALLAHPGLAATNLQVTTAIDGGMEKDSILMQRAQSAEDGATGIIRASLDPTSKSGNFYGPSAGWSGYPDELEPEELLLDQKNIDILWNGCEAAVGTFEF
ncbi:MAG: SDR family NAD(P)-dependent oxidoreductase [Schleiferiaceae bacterium]|jgi:NAD(P)-dependent dehydrogenase (short-subunit alcohol dehydrogenase family)|nr:SDR family NAD(P)-dependent oxidoreductase [Schleiferiaceae bacterium]